MLFFERIRNEMLFAVVIPDLMAKYQMNSTEMSMIQILLHVHVQADMSFICEKCVNSQRM